MHIFQHPPGIIAPAARYLPACLAIALALGAASPARAVPAAYFQALAHPLGAITPRGAAHRTTVAAPSIISGKITTATVSVNAGPGAPTLSIKFKAPGDYYANSFIFSGPSGQTAYIAYSVPPPGLLTSGTLTINQGQYLGGFNQFNAPGTWTLTQASITDFNQTTTTYAGSQLAGLFPSLNITVTNTGTPDTTPPAVSSGQLLTPTINAAAPGAIIRAQLNASDNLSGVATTYLMLNQPDGTPYFNQTVLVQNTQARLQTAVLAAPLSGAGIPAGVWTISGYMICDVAGNCLTETDPATLLHQLGGTSITVTN